LAALARAPRQLGGAAARMRCRPRSPHATRRARTADATDWTRIATLYASWRRCAVAGGRTEPRGRGRDGDRTGRPGSLVDRAAGRAALKHYHLLPSVRGDLLFKLGRHDEAAPSSSAPPR
jgi:predicted RNA polymerase sigma factor